MHSITFYVTPVNHRDHIIKKQHQPVQSIPACVSGRNRRFPMKEKDKTTKPMSRVFQNFVAPHGFWLFVRITGAVIGVAVEIFLAYVILEVVDKANAGDREGLKAAFS